MTYKRIRHSLRFLRNQEDFEVAYEFIQTLRDVSADQTIDLYFFDESGFSMRSNLPYGWGKQGVTHEQPANGHNKRLNVLGFLNLCGGFYGSYEKSRVTSDTVIEAFDEFIKNKSSNKTCFVVLDNAKTHKSKAFKKAQERWKEQGVLLYFIPPYSPELNLIEILWRHIKYHWLDLSAYKDFDKLCEKVKEILDAYGEKYQITFA